jgi:hypothetical protein
MRSESSSRDVPSSPQQEVEAWIGFLQAQIAHLRALQAVTGRSRATALTALQAKLDLCVRTRVLLAASRPIAHDEIRSVDFDSLAARLQRGA